MSLTIAISSHSFSKNITLLSQLKALYPLAQLKINTTGFELKSDALIDFLKDADRAITGLETLDSSTIFALPKLKHLSKYGVGLDMIDLKALHTSGKTLGFTPGVNKRAVSELTLNFMLELIRGSNHSKSNLKSKSFSRSLGFNLTGKTIGIIGCGHVGRDLIELLKPFQCKILINDLLHHPKEYKEFYADYSLTFTTVKELLSQSDIVTLHLPKNKETQNLITYSELSIMKPTAFILNAARGGLINEQDLLRALNEELISGAALDVFENEPNPLRDLIDHPRIICTPHIGGGSVEAMLAMGNAAIQNLENFSNPLDFVKYQ